LSVYSDICAVKLACVLQRRVTYKKRIASAMPGPGKQKVKLVDFWKKRLGNR